LRHFLLGARVSPAPPSPFRTTLAFGSLRARLAGGDPRLPFRTTLAFGSLRARLAAGDPRLPFRTTLAFGSLRARLAGGDPRLPSKSSPKSSRTFSLASRRARRPRAVAR
jgi:hypothetical protein